MKEIKGNSCKNCNNHYDAFVKKGQTVMEDIEKVMGWLEGLTFDDWRDCYSDSEVGNTAKAALELLKDQEDEIKKLRSMVEFWKKNYTLKRQHL